MRNIGGYSPGSVPTIRFYTFILPDTLHPHKAHDDGYRQNA
jgi:hypothetical protein